MQKKSSLTRNLVLSCLAVALLAPRAGAQTFQVAPTFGVGLGPRSAAIADFNEDGEQDLAVANSGGTTVSVLLGNGEGGFGSATSLTVGSFPRMVAIGDVNGDNHLDLAVANSGSGNVSVLLGNGAGGFAPAVSFPAGVEPSAIVVEDFNGDGDADLAVANNTSGNVSVLLGNGAGGFSAPTNYPVGTLPRGLASGDFNSDTVPDLVAANNGSADVSLLLGDGNGGFAAAVNFGAGTNPNGVAIADLNGDSDDDIVVPNFGSDDVTVRLGDGAGGFGPRTNYHVGIGPRTVVLGDWNSDGDLDLAVAASGSNVVGVRFGDGAGVFGALAGYGAGDAPLGLAAGKLDDDARVDLVAANFNSNNVSVLIGLNGGTFRAAPAFDVGTIPQAVAVADFNEDGKADEAVPNTGSDDVSVLLGDGAGGFSSGLPFAAGNAPWSVAVGDFNDDAHSDIAVANNQSNDVSILRGNGAGGFGAAVSVAVGLNPYSVAADDLNGDTLPDLVVANFGSDDVSVLLNDGAGGFGSASYGVGQQPTSVAIGLLNADSFPDLAVANQGSNEVTILLGDGLGGFASTPALPVQGGPRFVAFGDFNKDGDTDLAVANQGSNRFSVLLGDGAGGFGPPLYFASGLSPRGLVVGDFNGDSSPDVAVACHGSGRVFMFAGLGNGSFLPPIPIAVGNGPTAVAAADFNGDDKPDVAVVNALSNSVWTLLNTTNFLAADLAITKDDGQTEAAPGSPISYDIVVTNNGPDTVTSLIVLDTLPPELLTPVFTPGAGFYDVDTGEWTGLNLAMGQSATLVLDAIVDPAASGSVTNTVTVTAPVGVGDPVPGNNAASDVDLLDGLVIGDEFLTEADGTAVFAVNLTHVSGQTVSVDFATRNGTATAGLDYTAVSGTLIFPPGTLTRTIPVPVLVDALSEANEAFFVDLDDAVGAAILDGEGRCTIVDDDPPPSLAIDDISVLEGNSGNTPAIFTVSLSTPSGQPVSVDYATSDGTAEAGSDYIVASGTLVIPAGAPSGTISVPVKGDTANEPNETFKVTLSNPVAATISDGLGIGTILNDDGPAELSVDDVQVIEQGPGTIAAFTVTLSAPSANVVMVDYDTADGTALAGQDYTALSDTLTFPPGTTSQVIAVPILGDTTLESTEDYFVNLSNPTNATIGKGRGQGWILDQGAGQRLQFSAPSYIVKEGTAQAKITVKRIGGTSGTVSVDYEASDGSAVAGQDYTPVSGTLTFPPKVATRTFMVPIINDTVVDAAETISLGLRNALGGAVLGVPDAATLGVSDNDAGGILVLGAKSYSVSEAGPSVTVTVKRSGGTASGVTVQFDTSDGTATAGADYTGVSTVLSFAAGQTSQTVTIPILPDALFEGNETFGVAISNPTGGASLGKTVAAVVTIVEDEPTLQFSLAGYGVSEASKLVTLTVTRSGSSAGTVSVSYVSSDGTATAGLDYEAVSGVLTFGPKVTKKTFSVPLLPDTFVDPAGNETFLLTLTNPTGGAELGEPSTATVTINENDAGGSLYFSSATYSTKETNASATITVKRTGGSASGVSVDYATSDGTGQAGVDYVATSGTLTFAAGQTSRSVTVQILNDGVPGPDETVNLTLSDPGGGGGLGTPDTAVLTIVSDDPILQFSAATYSVGEKGPLATITVTRSSPTGSSVSVEYATSDGTASEGQDYIESTGTLTFGPGVTKQTFTVPIIDDPLVEGDETVNLTLSDPLGGGVLGPRSTAVLAILTDNPALQFSAIAYTVAENKVKLTVSVIRSGSTAGTVTVSYATSNGSATGGLDYAAAAGTLTFNPKVIKQSFTVTILNDTLVEGPETINLTLSSPGGGAVLGARSTAVATITSEDKGGTLSLSAALYSESELGPTAIITVTRKGGSASDVTLDYAALPGTAVPGVHFVPVSGTLVFASGETSKTFSVLVLDDQAPSGNKTVKLELSNAGGGGTLVAPATGVLWIVDSQ